MSPVRRLLIAGCATLSLCLAGAAWSKPPRVIVYDDFSKPGQGGYTINDYAAKWANPFGLGEMASTGGDTRSFKISRSLSSASPSRTRLSTSSNAPSR